MADVVIVGGGTAGSIVAARLSEDANRSVVLLEAGRDVTSVGQLPPVLVGHPPPSVRELPDTWRYDVELSPAPARGMSQFRGRVLGGSSSINGSLFIRGIPEDYDAWGSPLWCFDRVLPFFRKSETDIDFSNEFHGSDGPLRVTREPDTPLTPAQERMYAAALAAGCAEKADLNHPDGDGIGRVPMTTRSRSTALTYLAACRQRANLDVVPNTVARCLRFAAGRAVGVDVLRDDQPAFIPAQDVILSCGTFGSAQLLLASGVGPSDDLHTLGIPCVADLPGVGRNLRCHPMVTLRFACEAPSLADPDTPRLVLVHSVGDRNNLMLFPRQTSDGLSIMVTLRLASSAGALRLRSADPAVQPSIAYGYLAPADLHTLGEGLDVAVDLARRVGATGVADITHDWIFRHLETADHACGTCKLGSASDPLAVVDDMCRVRGVDGLHVVDLSIVPAPVRAGPYPTVVMLAERFAQLLSRGG